MSISFCAHRAGTRPIWLVAVALAIAVLAPPGIAHAKAGDQGQLDVSWNTYRPAGWSAGSVETSTGYSRAGGSERVREVQSGLNRLGYGAGEVDGLFGPVTQSAVRAFQADSGLAVDGIVGPQTLRGLRFRTSRVEQVLKLGTGYVRAGGSQRVREIQSRLNRLGFNAGEVDGLFGPITEFAVVSYQADKSLPVDGIVGPRTELALTGSTHQPRGSNGTQQTKDEQPGGQPRRNAGADGTRPVAWEASSEGHWWTSILWAALLALGASAVVLLLALTPRLLRIRSARRAARKRPKVGSPGAAGIQTARAGGPLTAAAVEKEEKAAPPPTLEWLVARIGLVEGPEEEAHLIHIGPELIAESDNRSWKTGLLDDQGLPFAIVSEVDLESSIRDVIVSEGLPRLVEILRKDGLDLSRDDLESMPLVVELSADLRERLAQGRSTLPSGGGAG